MRQEKKSNEINLLNKTSSLLTALALFFISVYVFGLGFIWLLQMLNIDMMIGGVVASQFAILLFSITLFKFKYQYIIDEFKVKLTLHNFLLASLVAVLFVFLAIGVNAGIEFFEVESTGQLSNDVILEYSDIVALLLGSVLFAPFFEELAFRAGLKHILVDNGGWLNYQYVIISAILFSLIHWAPGEANVYLMVLTFIMGIVFGIVYLRTGSLLTVIASHMIYNLSIIIIAIMV